MGEARYRLYTGTSGKLLKLMSLPPTEKNIFFHIMRPHLQTGDGLAPLARVRC